MIAYESAASVDHFAGFAGGHVDLNTGLVMFYHRPYDPPDGRWLTPDPDGFSAGDADLERYAGNDPTSRMDPLGLAPTAQQLLVQLAQAYATRDAAISQYATAATDFSIQSSDAQQAVNRLKARFPKWRIQISGVEDYMVLSIDPGSVFLTTAQKIAKSQLEKDVADANLAMSADRSAMKTAIAEITAAVAQINELYAQLNALRNPGNKKPN